MPYFLRMRGSLALRVIFGAGITATFAACALFSSLDDFQGGAPDASTDAALASDSSAPVTDAAVFPDAGPPPATGFTLAVLPTHITEDPGDTFPVDVSISRAASFNDAVTITLNGLPIGATASALVIPGNSSTGSFSLVYAAGSTVTNSDVTLMVVGANGTGAFSASADLAFRRGSLLAPDGNDAGTYTMPPFATGITAKLWGAGGGGSDGDGNGAYAPAPGGGGGFVSGSFAVTPGETLAFVLGAGGQGGIGGSGGGGFSELLRGTKILAIAGGGGGGGSSSGAYNSGSGSGGGGAGGGLNGQTAPSVTLFDIDSNGDNTSISGGGGGQQAIGGDAGVAFLDAGYRVASGGSCGASLQGGSALNESTVRAGGVPGGGNGAMNTIASSCGGGGGGGGYFGGGSGADEPTVSTATSWFTGGGGGSGYLDPSATNTVLTTGSGRTCANAADPDFIATTCGGGPLTGVGVSYGGAGLVVVRLSRP